MSAMMSTSYGFRDFFGGLMVGALGALITCLILAYTLNMTSVVAISVVRYPNVHRLLAWSYDNLRLSVIPFSLTLMCYLYALSRLKDLLKKEDEAPEKVAHAEQLVNVWISLFFGIGVIWTAIGLRSALLEGLGDLDSATAAQEGAFSILQRLVDGGILLALSTTIFGGIGGYIMRVIKSLSVGSQLQAYYNRMFREGNDELNINLTKIEKHLDFMEQRMRNPHPVDIQVLPEGMGTK